MSKKQNPLRVIQNVLHHAHKSEEAKHISVTGAGLSARMARVREFQAKRIAETYRDFTAQPQYASVMKFFQEDLYAARDFTQRDHDAERLHSLLSKFVPQEMLKLSADAIELTRVTHELDAALLQALVERMGDPEVLTAQLYAEAYRRCSNYDEREYQIDLLVRVMSDASETARFPLTGTALRMAKGPAYAAGWQEMYGFLERGYRAFKTLKQSERILEAVKERETRIMEQIKRKDAEPFKL